MAFSLHGERVIVRDWRDSDLEAYAALNADPEVRRFFPNVLNREQSEAEIGRMREHAEREGFTFWAVEVPGVAELIGFTGLLRTPYPTHFTPCVEIGWRLARAHWGKGYATEAAQLCLDWGFQQPGIEEIVALAAIGNRPSHAVMERLGMQRNPADDFDHPRLEAGHPLRPHLLYRIKRQDRLQMQA